MRARPHGRFVTFKCNVGGVSINSHAITAFTGARSMTNTESLHLRPQRLRRALGTPIMRRTLLLLEARMLHEFRMAIVLAGLTAIGATHDRRAKSSPQPLRP